MNDRMLKTLGVKNRHTFKLNISVHFNKKFEELSSNSLRDTYY